MNKEDKDQNLQQKRIKFLIEKSLIPYINSNLMSCIMFLIISLVVTAFCIFCIYSNVTRTVNYTYIIKQTSVTEKITNVQEVKIEGKTTKYKVQIANKNYVLSKINYDKYIKNYSNVDVNKITITFYNKTNDNYYAEDILTFNWMKDNKITADYIKKKCKLIKDLELKEIFPTCYGIYKIYPESDLKTDTFIDSKVNIRRKYTSCIIYGLCIIGNLFFILYKLSDILTCVIIKGIVKDIAHDENKDESKDKEKTSSER